MNCIKLHSLGEPQASQKHSPEWRIPYSNNNTSATTVGLIYLHTEKNCEFSLQFSVCMYGDDARSLYVDDVWKMHGACGAIHRGVGNVSREEAGTARSTSSMRNTTKMLFEEKRGMGHRRRLGAGQGRRQ